MSTVNELIEQIGGRERLEFIAENAISRERTIMARALLMVLDAQGSTVGCASCGGNGAVVIDHGEMGVEHMECPKCFKRPPAASVHDGWKIVPVDPTPEMLEEIWLDERFQERAMKARYAAMIAAAPSPGGEK